MKKRKIAVLLLLGFLGLGLGAQYVGWMRATRAFTANNLIRLHVIANSNEKKDQELKYKVRDQVIEALRQQLVAAKDCEEAREIIAKNRSHLASIAKAVVAEENSIQSVEGADFLSSKAYEYCVARREYEAVRVVLVKGKGAKVCALSTSLFLDISGDVIQSQSAVVRKPWHPKPNIAGESADSQEEEQPN